MMAIIYHSPLKSVGEPDTLKKWVKAAKDTALSYQQRHEAIGMLRGALTLYRHRPKHRAAVVWLKQQVAECGRILHSKEGHDV